MSSIFIKKKTAGIETHSLKVMSTKGSSDDTLGETLPQVKIHIIHAGPSRGIFHSNENGFKHKFKNQVERPNHYLITWEHMVMELKSFYQKELTSKKEPNDFWEKF